MAYLILNGEELEYVKGDKDDHSCHFYSAQYGGPSQNNSTRGSKKDTRWKELKVSLFGDDMILFREKPEDFTKKKKKVRSLDLINKLSSRIQIQHTKARSIPNTNSELYEKKLTNHRIYNSYKNSIKISRNRG